MAVAVTEGMVHWRNVAAYAALLAQVAASAALLDHDANEHQIERGVQDELQVGAAAAPAEQLHFTGECRSVDERQCEIGEWDKLQVGTAAAQAERLRFAEECRPVAERQIERRERDELQLWNWQCSS